MPPPLESMRIVARRLEPLNIPFAFLGGAVVCLLVDSPELTEFRPTKDVDVILEEDVITLIDGRASVVEEVASAPGQVRAFVAASFAEMLQQSDFLDAFPGHLSGMSGARQRAPLVMEQFRAIAALP